MSLPITPERLAAVYAMLRAWPPFARWGLPEADEVAFRVARTRLRDAAWWIDGGTHHIEASEKRIGHLSTLCAAMGHEMLHLHQRIARIETPNTDHNADFVRKARLLCARFGWDPEQFI